ncbi:MAG: polyphosphate kinase 1 [Gemmatimonadetes bacterium]|nr:polyphosphate kinase 1 [Gemmatimonadota bacterium]MYI62462.1 polyphosphate kinase 1 [Gemmatimonadota bacterium]
MSKTAPLPTYERTELYINQELSWLDFNARVLEEAQDERNPLLERVKFMAIVASNLDEFYEIRVAGLLQLHESGANPSRPDGLTPAEQLERITQQAHEQVAEQYRCWNEDLIPALAAEGIHFWEARRLKDEHLDFVRQYWEEELEPILTPIVVDPAHPFPHVLNKALCIGALLEEQGQTMMGVATVPRVLPRILRLPDQGDGLHFVTLAGIMDLQVNELFFGYEVIGSAPFRITRNSELYVNEEDADNLLEEIEEQVTKQRQADAVRLEIAPGAPDQLVSLLQQQFNLDDSLVFRVNGPVNLHRVMTLYGLVSRPALKDPPFTPVERDSPEDPDAFFDSIRAGDILLHHPYESFSTVIDFIRMAANDPKVLAIKQTIYRTGDDSEVGQALIDAAERGKEVTVLVELKARGDEAANIEWAKRLEDSGIHVIYGIMGLKTHCKLSMLVRRDQDRLRRYAHLGTGNYNHTTARLYTDLGLITAEPTITAEVAEVFNMLTAHSRISQFEKLLVAPSGLMQGMLDRIERESEHARAGRPAAIIAKMNGLMDPAIIRALYAASQAGVEIDLIVRGICCLRAGLDGISENIRVYSIIGRFLEHSRVFYFANGGDEEVWLGSADWMNRNLRARVEVVFPILDPALKQRVYRELLAYALADRAKSRQMRPDGTYIRRQPECDASGHSMQDLLMRTALGEDIDVLEN